MTYKAFISYSHQADSRLAPALQSALRQFAKPWYKRRAMHVFRDATDLSVNPKLWSSIMTALGDSEYLLLLASPLAAASPWVQREIEFWLANRSADKLLVVVTDGDLVWDREAGDYDWTKTTALPVALKGKFAEEPNYLDFRWTRAAVSLSLSDEHFADAVASLAATLYSRSKDELVGEDLRQHRKTLRYVRATALLLLVLLLAAIVAAVVARQQTLVARRETQVAEERLRAATARALGAAAMNATGDLPLGLLLSLVAVNLPLNMNEDVPIEAQQALQWTVQMHGGEPYAVRPWIVTPGTTVISPDGRRLFDISGQAVISDLAAGSKTVQARFALKGHRGAVMAGTFSADGQLLATAGADGTARVWDPSTARLVQTFTAGAGVVRSVAFSPDGRRLVAGGDSRRATVWNVASGQHLLDLVGHDGEIANVAWSADGTRIATGSADKTAWIWDAASGQPLRQLRNHPDVVRLVAFSPDGTRIATTSSVFAKIWDAQSGLELRTLSGHLTDISAMAFHPDGRRLATASHDPSVRLWDVATGQVLLTLTAGPKEDFDAVVFSRDGSRVATVGQTLRLYPLNTRELVQVGRAFVTRELTVAECREYVHADQCPPLRLQGQASPPSRASSTLNP